MLHGRLTFIHLATADTIVGDNSRALLRLVSGIHTTITCMTPFSKATVSVITANGFVVGRSTVS
ncbi:hypothetical protein T12_14624 [Trichinella patagoniensis]|uniref:Uncharacterized protein n=1 Tax=Trichinella patagoniensis TaxID=990121 RepID=A0A0V1AD22_9BILA|nr:hypothetical protein T12_14624 [Trichinella patagoniensis]